MKSRKGLLLLTVVLFGGLFFAFRKIGGSNTDLLTSQRQQLLTAVGSLLEKQHYSPKQINDDFSKQVFKNFLNDIDGDKILFSGQDINSLKKYETTIDDEIHGASIQFEPAVSALFDKKIEKLIASYKEILSKPFDFKIHETIELDGSKIEYANSEADSRDHLRKLLKFYTLQNYADLLEQREKNKTKKDFVVKSDADLEKDARDKVMKLMDKRYDRIKKTFTEDKRFSTFLNTITNLMDPHTDYQPPLDKRAFDEGLSGKFFGIGAILQQDDNGIKISSIQPGGAAFKSGELAVNDLIIKVAQGRTGEPVDIAGYDVQDAVKLIRGNEGTEVSLTVKKSDGTIKTINIMREKVVQDEALVRSAVIGEGNDKVGYIYLPVFYADFENEKGAHCSQDVAMELIKLKRENIKGVVLDIRNNGGGSLYEVIQMVGLFVNQGPVVQVRDRDGKSAVLSDRQPGVLYDGPLVVLVNELSASASEIFAAAIQDYKRGIIVGSSSTYGKGTVQRTEAFGNRIDPYSSRTDLGAVQITFQKFYRINGGATQVKGVSSDIVLPDSYEFVKFREKDNPSALPWDEIAKAPYQLQNNLPYESVITKENARIKQDPSLTLLNSNLMWIAKISEQPALLNLDEYRQQQKQLISTVEQNNRLAKAADTLKVEASVADKDKFYNNPDKAKGERYQAWLKFLKTDLQIDESVKVIADIASSANLQTVSK